MEQKSVSRAAHTAASLRSQLNQIAAASQMLESSTAGERSRSYLAVINQGVCRMLRTVGRLELEERLSSEEPKLSPAYLDLAPWLEDLGRRLDSILSAAGVRFSFTCPPALLIYTDTELLQQLLLEAITHLALTAGEIRLTTSASMSVIPVPTALRAVPSCRSCWNLWKRHPAWITHGALPSCWTAR